MLDALGEPHFELRCHEDTERPFDRLILPGGESTVQGRLLRDQGMFEPLRERIEAGMPVLGTCAGLILLASKVIDAGANDRAIRPERHLGTLDVTVERNAYGRQLASFSTTARFEGIGDVPMRFIRAPRIVKMGENVIELARIDGSIVAVRQRNQIATAFHPELGEDMRIHELFCGL